METTDQPGRERTRSNTLWTLGGCAVAREGDRLHLSTIVGGMAIMLVVLEMGAWDAHSSCGEPAIVQ